MDYIKLRFGNSFLRDRTGFEKTIEEMLQSINPICRFAERSWKPQMDMYEADDKIVIRAEIAGVKKEHLEIEISSNAVKICGRRMNGPHLKNAKYRLAEIQYGVFKRIMFLPVLIMPDQSTASYSNGLLQINLIKMAPGTRRIRIQDE